LVAISLVLGLGVRSSSPDCSRGFVFEIGPWDVGACMGTIIVLGGVALLATLLSPIRAATIVPIAVLHNSEIRRGRLPFPHGGLVASGTVLIDFLS
jgi:hypothetical protein